MSTRCQLRFTDKRTDRVAQIYRHSDGYPESVLSLLEHLQELVHVTGTQRDASYAAAQFILVDSLWYMESTFRCQDGVYSDLPDSVAEVLELESWEDLKVTPSYLLGHGVEDPSCGIHGDEEYLYQVELPTTSPFDEASDWQIKVSEHCGFPRWDEDGTEQAFEVADWKFEGTLAEAMENWVAMTDEEPGVNLPDGWEATTYELTGNFKLVAEFEHEETGANVRCNSFKSYSQPGFPNCHRVVFVHPEEGVEEIAVGMEVKHVEDAQEVARTAMTTHS